MTTTTERTYDIPYDARWQRRINRMYALLPPSDLGIVDFGAGECRLRELIGERPYFPVDRSALQPGVQEMNLDDWARGTEDTPPGKIAFCSGILEYLTELEAFVTRVAAEFDIFVFSFCVFVGRYPNERDLREERLWRNHQTTAEIITLCEKAGLRLEVMRKSKPDSSDYEYLFLMVPARTRETYLSALRAHATPLTV